jgi:cell division protein FtsW
LFYLPEAHTDFLFAVLAEELGFIGGVIVVGLFALLVGRALWLGYCAYRQQKIFHAYLAWGLGLLIGIQVMINVGVNVGLLPTKGLTLPFMSYGGSSLLMYCIALGVLVRISHETPVYAAVKRPRNSRGLANGAA